LTSRRWFHPVFIEGGSTFKGRRWFNRVGYLFCRSWHEYERLKFQCDLPNCETLKLLQCDVRGHIIQCHIKAMPARIQRGDDNAAARGAWASRMAERAVLVKEDAGDADAPDADPDEAPANPE